MTCFSRIISCICFLLLLSQNSFAARECEYALYLHSDYPDLIDIAAKNKGRRTQIAKASGTQRAILVKEHLLQSLPYEEEKSKIYVRMMKKLILRGEQDYQTTLNELATRLKLSITNHESLRQAIKEEYALELPVMHLEIPVEVEPYLAS